MDTTKALFSLTSAESKRLLAKAVAALPEVQNALKKGTVIIGAGTTNAFVLEEIMGKPVDKARYTAGVIAGGRQCVTAASERLAPAVIVDGVLTEQNWEEAIEKIDGNDVFIKGGNAIDVDGVVGVQMAHEMGGTIGTVLPIMAARGAHLIMPVGLEKLIPSVEYAANMSGTRAFDMTIGMPVGLMPVNYGTVYTEVTALEELAAVEAVCISAGGIDGSEGSVTMAIEGPAAEVEKIFALIKDIKGEQPLGSHRQKCSDCSNRCDYPGA